MKPFEEEYRPAGKTPQGELNLFIFIIVWQKEISNDWTEKSPSNEKIWKKLLFLWVLWANTPIYVQTNKYILEIISKVGPKYATKDTLLNGIIEMSTLNIQMFWKGSVSNIHSRAALLGTPVQLLVDTNF